MRGFCWSMETPPPVPCSQQGTLNIEAQAWSQASTGRGNWLARITRGNGVGIQVPFGFSSMLSPPKQFWRSRGQPGHCVKCEIFGHYGRLCQEAPCLNPLPPITWSPNLVVPMKHFRLRIPLTSVVPPYLWSVF